MKRKLLLLPLICVTATSPAQQPVYYQVTPNNGLPSNEVYDVEKDSAGYLWFATDRGLARYDGSNFRVYTTNDGLSDNVVTRLYVSPAGTLWAVCKDQNLYRFKQDAFVMYEHMPELKHVLPESSDISRIVFEQEKPAVFSASYLGRVLANGRGGFSTDTGKTSRLFFDAAKQAAYYRYGEFISKGSLRSCTGDYTCEGIMYNSGSKHPPRTSYVKGTGPYAYMQCNNRVFTLEHNRIKSSVEFPWPVSAMFADNNRQIWICFLHQGARVYRQGEPLLPETGKAYFTGKNIMDMSQDYEGGYWFTSYHEGVFYVPDINVESVEIPGLAPHEYIKEISGNYTDRLYMVTSEQRIVVMEQDKAPELFNIRDSDMPLPPLNMCNELYYDRAEHKLLIAYSDRIYSFDDRTETLSRISLMGRGLDKCQDRLYMVNAKGLFNYSSNTFEMLSALPEPAYAMHADNHNCIWIGTNNGLVRYDGRYNRPAFAASIRSRINSIKKLGNGALVGATLGEGLFVVSGNSLTRISLGSSVQQNMVNDLAAKGNTVWAATEKGVVQVDLSNLARPVLRSWSAANGFPYNDIRKIYVQDNKLYTLSQNRLLSIKLGGVDMPRSAPRVLLHKVVVNDSRDAIAAAHPVFQHKDNKVKFYFSGLSFRSGASLKYRYRLKGLDTQWQTIQQPFVEFASLSAGSYVFELMAVNDDSMIPGKAVSYTFSIPVPFWQQQWFNICTLLSLLILCWLVIRHRFNVTKKRNREKETMLQYEQQALSAQINPHFIFNALNSMQNFILQEDKRNALRYMTRFSRLMRLNLDNARLKWIPPVNELQLLNNYLELEKLRYKNRFSYSIEADYEMLGQLLIPSMLIQPFIENAILHGVKHLEDREGEILVKLELVNNRLLCRIDDNGVGCEAAMMLNNSENHKSSGLVITRKRLQLLCAEAKMPYRLEIIDKKNFRNGESGTLVIFNLPYKKAPVPVSSAIYSPI